MADWYVRLPPLSLFILRTELECGLSVRRDDIKKVKDFVLIHDCYLSLRIRVTRNKSQALVNREDTSHDTNYHLPRTTHTHAHTHTSHAHTDNDTDTDTHTHTCTHAGQGPDRFYSGQDTGTRHLRSRNSLQQQVLEARREASLSAEPDSSAQTSRGTGGGIWRGADSLSTQ